MDSQQFLPLITIIVGAFALILFYYTLKISSRLVGHKNKTAPETPGACPLLGHFPILARYKLPHIELGALADKYGPIFTLRIGLRRAVVVSDWEVAQEIFTANDKAVSARPELVATRYLSYNYAMFLFTPSGSYWQDMRKFSTSEFLVGRGLEQAKHVMLQEVGSSLRQVYKTWKDKRNANDHSGQALVELIQWFGELNLNVFLRLIAGKKYFGDGAVGDVEEGRRCWKAIRELLDCLGLVVLRDAIPLLGWLDVGGHEKEMKRVAKDSDKFAQEWIEEHKRKESLGEAKGDRDFMDALISFLNGRSVGGYDADTINKATSLGMIAAGNEPTLAAMTWVVALLLNNRHTLRKAQEELDTHIGNDRLVNPMDIHNLVYLRAIVKEALRLYPPGPIPVPRQFLEDCTIKGYFVPKGTWLMLNLWKIQRDPRVWPEPLEFKPERFLTTHRNVDVRGQNFELTPFGSGRRSCPGISFALQMLHLTLASLLHAFDISTPGNEPVDMTQKCGLISIKATPLQVLVSPRLSPKCFE